MINICGREAEAGVHDNASVERGAWIRQMDALEYKALVPAAKQNYPNHTAFFATAAPNIGCRGSPRETSASLETTAALSHSG